jgi:ABC-type amino acid transport substrate-binding protein
MSTRALFLTFLALVAARPASLASTPSAARAPLRVVLQGASTDFDREVLASFAKTSGRPIVETASSAGDALEAVRSGRADLVAGVLASGGRLDSLVATSEVFPSRLVAVTRSPAPAATIESLRWRRIGTLRGSRAAGAIRDAKLSGAEAVEAASLEAALVALGGGSVDALLLELPEALVARRRDGALVLGAFLGTRQSLVYAVRAEDRTLLAQLDAHLGSVRRTPSWAALLARGLSPEVFEALSRARLTD